MVHYTVRDATEMVDPPFDKMMRPLATGTMHYSDYREVQGVLVPFEQTVTLPPPALTHAPVSERYFHRLVLEDARFDEVPRETLVPAPERGTPSGSKPEVT